MNLSLRRLETLSCLPGQPRFCSSTSKKERQRNQQRNQEHSFIDAGGRRSSQLVKVSLSRGAETRPETVPETALCVLQVGISFREAAP